VISKEPIGTTGYRLGGSPRRLLIFDARERLVLILRLTKDKQPRDAGLIGDPQILRGDLPRLLAALGITHKAPLKPSSKGFTASERST